MSRPRELLVVIADGEHVRFVRKNAANALHTVKVFDSITAHKQSSDLASSRPGASFSSTASARHAETPRHDPHTLAKEAFAKAVADQINQDAPFDALILVAPAHVMATIDGKLSLDAHHKLIGSLEKDLVKVPDEALQPHLAAWVAPHHHL